MFVDRVNQLGVSRSEEIRLEICSFFCISLIVSVSNCPRFFGQPEDAYMGSGSMVHSDPSQSFGITSLLFSGYTIFLSGRVSREQPGGAAEILSRIGVDHGS